MPAQPGPPGPSATTAPAPYEEPRPSHGEPPPSHGEPPPSRERAAPSYARGPRPAEGATQPGESGMVVRWAVFSCVLVPVVLVVYGTSAGGAAGAALGLTAVTAVCRLLLVQSERAAAAHRLTPPQERARGALLPGQGGPRGRRRHGGLTGAHTSALPPGAHAPEE